jgi:glycosyltransferase involved in cell wall biosynthesis
MIIGVDASNLRYGGGTTHLIEVLGAANPPQYGVERVVVWGARATLDRLADRPWLERVHEPALDGSFAERTWWQRVLLPKRAKARGCDLHWAPGGTAPSSLTPRVVMCRNMLPFDDVERSRYGATTTRLRLEVLLRAQTRSFATADGVIFLTRYAADAVGAALPRAPRQTAIIPHGIHDRFRSPPKAQHPLAAYTQAHPFRCVYVSTLTRYKHQAVVADAFRMLRAEGLPVALDLVGLGDDPTTVREVDARARVYDPTGRWLVWRGTIPFAELTAVYHRADAAVYASSCENMPNILIESMAAGLPIASSNRGPMPEILGAAGLYFDPECARDIAYAVRTLIRDPALRSTLAAKAYERALQYSWRRCADETFAFLAAVVAARPTVTR